MEGVEKFSSQRKDCLSSPRSHLKTTCAPNLPAQNNFHHSHSHGNAAQPSSPEAIAHTARRLRKQLHSPKAQADFAERRTRPKGDTHRYKPNTQLPPFQGAREYHRRK